MASVSKGYPYCKTSCALSKADIFESAKRSRAYFLNESFNDGLGNPVRGGKNLVFVKGVYRPIALEKNVAKSIFQDGFTNLIVRLFGFYDVLDISRQFECRKSINGLLGFKVKENQYYGVEYCASTLRASNPGVENIFVADALKNLGVDGCLYLRGEIEGVIIAGKAYCYFFVRKFNEKFYRLLSYNSNIYRFLNLVGQSSLSEAALRKEGFAFADYSVPVLTPCVKFE